MDEIKLENWQKHDTQALLDKHMAKIIDGIREIVGNVNDQQLYKIIVNHTRETLRITKEDAIRSDIQLYYPNLNTKSIINALINTVQVYNVAGLVLRYKYTPQVLNLYLVAMYNNYQRMTKYQRKDCTLFEQLYNRGFFVIFMNAAEIMKPNEKKAQRLCRQMKKFRSQQIHKHYCMLVRECRFDREKIDEIYEELDDQNYLDTRKKTFVKLYDKYGNDHNSYLFMQYLLTISTKEFQEQFQVKNDADLEILVHFIEEDYVNNISELKMKAAIAKHVEYSRISFNFSNQFHLVSIKDDVVISILDNIENRVQYTQGPDNIYFIIICRLSDNKILKSVINYNNQQQIEDMLKECNNGELYDVIIRSNKKYINLENVRIRYLDYSNLHDNINIFLLHPQDLASVRLSKVKLTNINQCANLKNLHSEYNTYTKQDILPLCNIKRIYSQYDTYQDNDTCLLADLFQNNRLEYIYIRFGDNITFPITLSYNIDNLRYIDAEYVKIGIEYFGDSLDRLFELFEKKYVDRDPNSQDIDVFDQYQLKEYVGEDNYIRWQQLTLGRNAFDPLSYKCRMLNILLSQDGQQEQMLLDLAEDVAQYRRIEKAGHENINQAIDVNNLKELKQYMVYCKQHDNDIRTMLMKCLYDMNCDNVEINYNILILIQYLATVDNDSFIAQFGANNEELKQIAQCVGDYKISTNKQLRLTSYVCKYLEYKKIYLKFNDNFKLNDVPDDVLVRLFENIENRIQMITGSQNFIIIHRISDKMILKNVINQNGNNQYQIEDLLKQCQDGELYDVVIKSEYQYESLRNVKIRYLNYYSLSNNIQITLSHPEDLISVSLRYVKLANMSECVNLKNLHSEYNTYTKQDILPLRNLKRIHSDVDKYTGSDTCFLADLFQNSKLEYAYAFHGQNIIGSFTISKNTKNLRFMKIYQWNATYDIKLDISNNVPENLSVYDVQIQKNSKYLYGTLEGGQAEVSRIERRLIHDLKRNQ